MSVLSRRLKRRTGAVADPHEESLHCAGLAVAAIEQSALAAELAGLDDLDAVGAVHRNQRAGGDVEAGLDHAFVAQADADTGFRAK